MNKVFEKVMPGDIVQGEVLRISASGEVVLDGKSKDFDIVSKLSESDVYLAWCNTEIAMPTSFFPINTAFKIHVRYATSVKVKNSVGECSDGYYFYRFRKATEEEIKMFIKDNEEHLRKNQVEEKERAAKNAIVEEAKTMDALKEQISKLTSISHIADLVIAAQNRCSAIAKEMEKK